jgi:hypothetical protein
MKEKSCANCVYCEEISPLRYFENNASEEYQGYCKKKGYYLLTIDDRCCSDNYEEDMR